MPLDSSLAPVLPSHDRMRHAFHRFAYWVSDRMGSPVAFCIATMVILTWAISGPMFGFSDTWQLYINTSTTIVTFLMVFLIQNTQNRDAKATHLKLDELIRGVRGARTSLVHLEEWTDDELADLAKQFERLRQRVNESPQVLAEGEPADDDEEDAPQRRSA